MIVSPPNDSPRQFRTDNMGTSPSERQTHRIFTSTWLIFWPLLNIWWKLIKCQLFRRRTSNFQLHQVAPPPRNHKSSPPHITYYQQFRHWVNTDDVGKSCCFVGEEYLWQILPKQIAERKSKMIANRIWINWIELKCGLGREDSSSVPDNPLNLKLG